MIEDIYDASGEQVQYWLHQTRDGEAKEQLVISFELLFENPDIGAIEKSIRTIQQRHESLRTYLKLINGEVKQCVIPYASELFSPLYYDASDESNTQKAVLEIKESIARSLNNISVPPLFKCCIIKCSGRNHLIAISIHHIISDVWSGALLYKELTYLYESFKNGRDIESNPDQMQLRDYAMLQKKWLAANGKAAQKYWHSKLSRPDNGYLYDRLSAQNGFPGKLSDIPPSTGTDTGHIVYSIDGLEFSQLKQFSAYCNSSIFAVICSSIQLLFFLLAGKKSILISTPFANRYIPGTETVIGWLIGTVYLQREIREEKTVKELINDGSIDFLRSCRYPIYNHDDLQLNGKLQFHTDIFINFAAKEFKIDKTLGPHGIRQHYIEKKGSFFELVFLIDEYEDCLSCHWMYTVGLYSYELINYVLTRYQSILNLMFKNPEISITQLEKLLLDEQSDDNDAE
jgi:hypothetical protein